MNSINKYRLPALFLLIACSAGCNEDEYRPPVNNAPIPRILELRPQNVSSGDTLSIVGLNFSPFIEENEVKLNKSAIDILHASDTLIKVIVPEFSGNTAGVSVRSRGKISNKRNISLVTVKLFEDDFNRDDQSPVGPAVIPNPLGSNWQIVAGTFELRSNSLFSEAGGLESYMLYRDPELNMNAGEGSYFRLVAEMSSSPESFAGVIFNAQNDNKRFYLLRTTNNLLQLLKTGGNGLGDWAAIILNQPVEGFAPNTRYKAEISSSQPGRINIKVSNANDNGILFEQSVEDADPYTGGSPGLYYFGLANPVAISFDNFSVEIQ